MRATSSGGFGSARGILERCCRPWPFSPRGTSNTTERPRLERLARFPLYIGSRQLLHYSRWPMANRARTRYHCSFTRMKSLGGRERGRGRKVAKKSRLAVHLEGRGSAPIFRNRGEPVEWEQEFPSSVLIMPHAISSVFDMSR